MIKLIRLNSLFSSLFSSFFLYLCTYLVFSALVFSSIANSSQAFAENKQATENILIIGDSISAGYGLHQDESWVSLLQTRLDKKHYPYKVINASLTGDTTGGASKRIKKALDQHQPAIVIIELGGNDGLRGFSIKKIQSNLASMIEICQKNNHRVLLVGMQLPPNYGPTYTKRFSSIYQTLATEKKTALVPFLLKGIADKTEYFQADQIHPNAGAQIYLLNNIWPELVKMLNH